MKYRLLNLETQQEKQYANLKQISKELDVPIYVIRSINSVSENRAEKHRPHFTYRKLYNTIKIFNIAKTPDVLTFP